MDEEIDLDSLKSYSSPDVLICGNCRFLNIFIVKFYIGDNDDHYDTDNDDNVAGWYSPRSTQWSPTRGTTAS